MIIKQISVFVENKAGRLAEIHDALGNATSYRLNGRGLPVEIIDALGQKYTMEYDAAGNLIKETLPDGSSTQYAYNRGGRLIRMEDADGLVTEYEYDVLGNVTKETNNAGLSYTYTYNAVGLPLTATDALGQTTRYTYDNAGNLISVQEFDGNDSWGYNPCFFFAMDKAYGTKTMYKQFIDACHEAGMAVILDVVYNHATGNNPLAKLYWDGDKTAKNNPYFNVEAPHPYSVFHDFNHESPLVRKFVKRNLQFLLKEYKVDGFRFDLTKGFTQTSCTESTASNYDAGRIAVLKDYNAAIKEVKKDSYVILEHFCDSKEENELAADGMHLWRNLNNAYCQSAMGYAENSSFSSLYEKNTAWVGFMESHDEERTAYKQSQWGDGVLKTDLDARMNQLALNTTFFLTVPGPKMVWQFGEMGYDISIEENGRTGRKPLHWEYLDNADRKGLHDVYAGLMKLRNAHPELFDANATLTWKVETSDWDNGRTLLVKSITGKQLVVVGNFTHTATDIVFPATPGNWTNYFTGKSETVNKQVNVPAHGYVVYTNF